MAFASTGTRGRGRGLAAGLAAWAALASAPAAAVVLESGDLIVTRTGTLTGGPSEGIVYRVDLTNGVATVVSSGGLMFRLNRVEIDAGGDLLISSRLLGSPNVIVGPGILRVDPETGEQSVVSAGGLFGNPQGFAIDANGDLYVADLGFEDDYESQPERIIHVDVETGEQTLISEGGRLLTPVDVAIAPDGDLLVADRDAPSRFTPSGAIVRVDRETGAQSIVPIAAGGQVLEPVALAYATNGMLLVLDSYGSAASVLVVDPETGEQFPLSVGGLLSGPRDFALEPTGNLLVLDSGSLLRIGLFFQELLASRGIFAAASGIAVVPSSRIAASPDPLDLGAVALGASAEGTITLRNAGGGELDVSGVEIVDDPAGVFTLVAPPIAPFGLSAGETIDMTIAFSPVALGPATATLRVTSDDPALPVLSLAILGEGVPLPVAIDVRPATEHNFVSPGGPGLIPVAVLGGESFDVATIDRATLAFGPAGAAPLGSGGFRLDVNRDGWRDLVSFYRIDETGIAPGDGEACVTGATVDGVPFEGCDTVVTIACGLGPELTLLLPALLWWHRRRLPGASLLDQR